MKSLKILALLLTLVISMAPLSQAVTFNDPINTAVNQIRNAIMNTQWAREIMIALDHLNELRNQTMELLRFHAGLDEILDSFIGNPLGDLVSRRKTALRDAFIDAGLIVPQIEIFEGGGGPRDIRAALEEITGGIPEGNLRPYIPFEEMLVVDAFDFANQIREAGSGTRDAADLIAEQAKTASPKGAARLHAQGVSQLMVLEQQNQEALAKLIELNAARIEQGTRLSKESERERIEYLQDANEFLEGYLTNV